MFNGTAIDYDSIYAIIAIFLLKLPVYLQKSKINNSQKERKSKEMCIKLEQHFKNFSLIEIRYWEETQ